MPESNSEIIGKLASNIALEWLTKAELSSFDVLAGAIKDFLTLLSNGCPESTPVLDAESVESFLANFKEVEGIQDFSKLAKFLQTILTEPDPAAKNEKIKQFCQENRIPINTRSYAHRTINKMKLVWLDRAEMAAGIFKPYVTVSVAVEMTGKYEEHFVPFFIEPEHFPKTVKIIGESKSEVKIVAPSARLNRRSDTDRNAAYFQVFNDVAAQMAMPQSILRTIPPVPSSSLNPYSDDEDIDDYEEDIDEEDVDNDDGWD